MNGLFATGQLTADDRAICREERCVAPGCHLGGAQGAKIHAVAPQLQAWSDEIGWELTRRLLMERGDLLPGRHLFDGQLCFFGCHTISI